MSCCGDDDYTHECIYKQLSANYQQSYPQGILRDASGCGMFGEQPHGNPVDCRKSRVEVLGTPERSTRAMAGTIFLKDPHLMEVYAPFIPEMREERFCGR